MIWTLAFMRPGLFLIHSSFQGLTWKSRMFTIAHFPWSLLTSDFAPASKDVLSFSVSEPPLYLVTTGFPGDASGREPACQCRRHKRHGFNPELGISPGEGHGSPVQYSCLENPMDRGIWRAIVHGVARVGHDLATEPLSPALQVDSLSLSHRESPQKTVTGI